MDTKTSLLVLAPLLSFLMVAILMPRAAFIAVKTGFVDHPGGRKQHEGLVPPIGGLVIFFVFLIIGPFYGVNFFYDWPLIISLLILLGVGALDDRFHINAWIKFTTQLCVALLVTIIGKLQIHTLGNLFGFGGIWLDIFSVPFTMLALVLFINAINLMDGLDGLAGGITFIVFFWFVIACILEDNIRDLPVLLVFLGSLAGFLIYNMRSPFRKKASVFLGDAGSMCLGLMIGWYAIKLAQYPGPTLIPISVAWIIGLPIFDECAQFYRRVREGRHPFSPDRGHFHHHFLDAGFTPASACVTILIIVFFLGALGLFGIRTGVPQPVLSYLWIVALFIHIAISYSPSNYVGIIRRIARRKQ